jgi:ubiquinone/menaquinone biosynthesis C-methylase UbiE
MRDSNNWHDFWERNSAREVSDYEFDRGTIPRDGGVEELANAELIEFIDADSDDVVFDAGCGTGANLLLLQRTVRRMIGMDYSAGAIDRCKKRMGSRETNNVEVFEGTLTEPPLPDASVDKIICMSVLQYLSDADLRLALQQFARMLKPGGTLVLHVKNISSLYLATLRLAKRAKAVLGGQPKLEYVRSYRWYVKELASAGFQILYYNSFNLFMIEFMPRRLLRFTQKLELKYRHRFPFRTGFIRRHGADLKIKAQIAKAL